MCKSDLFCIFSCSACISPVPSLSGTALASNRSLASNVTWKNAKQQSSLWTELPSFDIDPVLPNIFPSCCLLFAVTLIHGCGLATLNVASPSHCMNYSMFSVIPRQSAWRVCMNQQCIQGLAWCPDNRHGILGLVTWHRVIASISLINITHFSRVLPFSYSVYCIFAACS